MSDNGLPRQPPRLVRVVRDEEGRPPHRGRVHLLPSTRYTTERQVRTLCGMLMWVAEATSRDVEMLQSCLICKQVPAIRELSRRRA